MIRAATVILCLPLLYVAVGFAGAIVPGRHADLPAGSDVLIGLARAPIHYDFLLPLSPELRAREIAAILLADTPLNLISHVPGSWLRGPRRRR